MSELTITIPTLKSCTIVAYLYIQSINLKQHFHVSSQICCPYNVSLCHTDTVKPKKNYNLISETAINGH